MAELFNEPNQHTPDLRLAFSRQFPAHNTPLSVVFARPAAPILSASTTDYNNGFVFHRGDRSRYLYRDRANAENLLNIQAGIFNEQSNSKIDDTAAAPRNIGATNVAAWRIMLASRWRRATRRGHFDSQRRRGRSAQVFMLLGLAGSCRTQIAFITDSLAGLETFELTCAPTNSVFRALASSSRWRVFEVRAHPQKKKRKPAGESVKALRRQLPRGRGAKTARTPSLRIKTCFMSSLFSADATLTQQYRHAANVVAPIFVARAAVSSI